MLRPFTLALLVTVLAAALRPPAAHAHAQRVSISVGRNGFESVVDYTLDVEAGHEVSLTFTYADGDLEDDNPHDIRLKGLGLELPTVRVSRDQPTATLTFTPEKTGRLRLLCVVPCLGMENLVGGVIKAAKPRATGAPTSLTLELRPRDDGSLLARATLLDAGGGPLTNAPIVFTQRTALGGDLVLGRPTTMEDGGAVVKIPATGSEAIRVTAAFEGGDGLAYAEAYGEITAPGQPMAHQPGPLAAPTAPPALALTLLIVLGGVWTTYGFVVVQLVRIRRR
mgnify:CR=1 FL=1